MKAKTKNKIAKMQEVKLRKTRALSKTHHSDGVGTEWGNFFKEIEHIEDLEQGRFTQVFYGK